MHNDIAPAASEVKRHDLLNTLSYRRQVRALHNLGHRALAEMIAETATSHPQILDTVGRYAAIDPQTLKSTGGDEFPASVFLVPSKDLDEVLRTSVDIIHEPVTPPRTVFVWDGYGSIDAIRYSDGWACVATNAHGAEMVVSGLSTENAAITHALMHALRYFGAGSGRVA